MNTKQKVLKFIVRFVLLNAHLLFPAIYLMLGMLLMWTEQVETFAVEGLVFLAVLGALVCFITRAWLSHQYDVDEIDLIGLDERLDPEDKKLRLADFTRFMPWWERLLWMAILVLQVLDGVILFTALRWNFVSDHEVLAGVIAVIIQFVLFVLLLMVSRKRHVVWVVLAYLIIDFCACFQFTKELVEANSSFYSLFCTLFFAPLGLALLIAAVHTDR